MINKTHAPNCLYYWNKSSWTRAAIFRLLWLEGAPNSPKKYELPSIQLQPLIARCVSGPGQTLLCTIRCDRYCTATCKRELALQSMLINDTRWPPLSHWTCMIPWLCFALAIIHSLAARQEVPLDSPTDCESRVVSQPVRRYVFSYFELLPPVHALAVVSHRLVEWALHISIADCISTRPSVGIRWHCNLLCVRMPAYLVVYEGWPTSRDTRWTRIQLQQLCYHYKRLLIFGWLIR